MRNVEVIKGYDGGVTIEIGDVMSDYDNRNGSRTLSLSEAEAALLMEKLRNTLVGKRR